MRRLGSLAMWLGRWGQPLSGAAQHARRLRAVALWRIVDLTLFIGAELSVPIRLPLVLQVGNKCCRDLRDQGSK